MAYTEPPASKPFKVCPEIVEAKDTPCRVLGPTAAVVHRMETPTNRITKEKIIYVDNPELLEKIKKLEEELAILRAATDAKNKSKIDTVKPAPTGAIRGNEVPPIDIDKPSNTRAIRG